MYMDTKNLRQAKSNFVSQKIKKTQILPWAWKDYSIGVGFTLLRICS